jgi:uridine kinase
MRIGIYCSGYLRGFRTSLLKLKELFLDKYECDLYFYLISNEYESDKYINTKYAFESLIKDCNPKFYILEKNVYDDDPIHRIKQMWFKIYICNKVRIETEKRDSIKYDYIIRIRPDCKLECSENEIKKYIELASTGKLIISSFSSLSYPSLELDSIKNIGNFNDQFALGNSDVMNVYCNLYNCLNTYNNIGINNSSSCLYEHLLKNRIDVSLVDCSTTLLLKENIIITISGDSGVGKTTFAGKLKEYLESLNNEVLLFECDRYHKWPRGDTNWKTITHLNPKANRIDQMKDDIIQLKSNKTIKQVDYNHYTGQFTEEYTIRPLSVVIALGLHTLLDVTLNKLSDCKIFIDPEFELQKKWKIFRDNKERGYTIEQTLKNLESRRQDYNSYIKPQKDNADIIIKYKDTNIDILIKQKFVLSNNNINGRIENEYIILEVERIEDVFPFVTDIIF